MSLAWTQDVRLTGHGAKEQMVIRQESDMRGFFHERVEAALTRLTIRADAATALYLGELLADSVTGLVTDEPIAYRLADAIETEEPRLRREKLQKTGDAALYTCGFFQEHIDRRGLSVDYYVAMGGRAYASAAEQPGPHRETLAELAHGFESFAMVLDEVREETTLRTPQDIVRLYDRWQRTRSPKLAARLQREGVFPGEGALGKNDKNDDGGWFH